MKKLVSFLLALVLTLSLTTNALAAVVSPKADATEITADQTVKLTVTASEDEKLTGSVCLNYRVYFDPAFFELDADASAANFEGAKLTALKTDDRGSYYAVSLLDTTSAGLTVSGDLYTLAFKVKDGAKVGDTSKLTLVKAYVYTIEDGAMKPMDNGAVDNGEVTVKIVAPAPADVTLTGAKVVSNGIQVTWQAADGAAQYRVYRKAEGVTKWSIIAHTTDTSYVDKTAEAGVKYTYTVRGIAADGKTLSSGYDGNGVSAMIPKSTAPADVKLVGAKAVSGGIQVTWQAADGAAQYRVYRKAEGATKWSIIAHTTGTSYVDKTAEAGVKYTYTVRGIAADGKTLSSGYDGNGVSAMIPKSTAPAIVKLTGAKEVNGGIQVTWQAADGAAQYRVYRKDAVNTGWTVLTSSATGTSFVDKTAVAGVTYTYTVRGVAKDGKTLSPSYDKVGVSAVIAPAKVVLVSAKADSAGILVTWQKAAGAHSYQVFRKTANTGWQRIAKNIHDTEWKDIDAVKGTKYFYTVRAVADDGTTRGAYDGTGKTATVTKNPTTPADVTLDKAVAGKSGITVTWSYAADARTYRVYRKAAGETKWTIVAKNAKGKSWTDKNVTKGVKYTYTVRGVNANGVLSSRYNGTGVSAIAK